MPSTLISDVHIGQNGEWKVPGARWLAIMLAVVLLEAVCFYALRLFAMDTTHLVWMSVNLGALMFGPVIWREHRRIWRKGASSSARQAERQREQERQGRFANCPQQIIEEFQAAHYLPALALVVSWGGMGRTAGRSIYYKYQLQRIHDTLHECAGLITKTACDHPVLGAIGGSTWVVQRDSIKDAALLMQSFAPA